MRTGSVGGRLARVWASWRREPQIPGAGGGLVSLFFFWNSFARKGKEEDFGGGGKIRTVVLCVVVGVLDRVSTTDGGGVVVRIAFVGGEVDFFEEFGFVVFEGADCV